MKTTILAATCVAALSTFTSIGAFAQTSTGPAAQQDNMTKDKMGKEDGMKKEGMGTTGMNNNGMSKDGMSKQGMSKDMSKDGSPKADPVKKGN
jgi:pentapeptide MXKDX repeat protein